jgi:hypothetical protein
MSNKYKWITDSFHADSPQNCNFSLEEEENCIDIISYTSLKVQFSRKLYIDLGVDIRGEFPHLNRKT